MHIWLVLSGMWFYEGQNSTFFLEVWYDLLRVTSYIFLLELDLTRPNLRYFFIEVLCDLSKLTSDLSYT